MNPNRLNVTAVIIRKATIHTGCMILMGMNSDAVARITSPRAMDFEAAAPT